MTQTSARDGAGNPTGLLLAKPNAAILYATLAKGPKLPLEYQLLPVSDLKDFWGALGCACWAV